MALPAGSPPRPAASGREASAKDGTSRPAAKTRWRVLLVDDSADDAELTRIELHGAGIDADCLWVEGEAALRAALDGPEPQLVLSDLNMPGFDGPRALAIVRERAPAARFVFLTGAIAEDAVLPEADGVLLKDELHALPALVRELLGA